MATIHQLFKNDQSGDLEDMSAGNEPAAATSQVALVALTSNANLLDIVQRAAPRGVKVIPAGNVDAMLSLNRSHRPGLLLIDTEHCRDIAGTVIQQWQELPELVVIAAGESEESSHLMKLTAAGHLYRFLLKPLAHNQTKLTLEAALNHHTDQVASADRRSHASMPGSPDAPRKNYLPTYVGLGVAVIAVAGAAFFGLSRLGNDSNESAPTGVTTPASSTASTELDLADAALAAGKLLEPPGENALDLYRSALSIDPKNTRAQAGIENVANKLLEKAETALGAEQLEAAVTALEQARDVSPDSSRLKFLDGQLARERERLKLTQSQDLGKKIRALLADAQQHMDAGRLLSPASGNARNSLLEARRLDATDPSVAATTRALSSQLIDAARRSAEQGQTEQAQGYLQAARQLGSAGADLSAAERSINTASAAATSRANAATEAQLAAARQAAAAAQAERDAALAAAAEAQKRAADATKANEAAKPLTPVTLKRTKTVTPVYPEGARNRDLSGWVDVAFVVNEAGNVTNARVVDANPKDVFNNAALTAIEQWRFEPPTRDGMPTTQATKVKLRFDSPK